MHVFALVYMDLVYIHYRRKFFLYRQGIAIRHVIKNGRVFF